MKPHTWIKEYVDGGPVGDGEFFLCTGCGCSGGCADWETSVPHPFLPGPALDVSEDCDVAHEQIRFFALGSLRQWHRALLAQIEYGEAPRGWERHIHGRRLPIKKDWHEAPGAAHFILLSNAEKWTPKSVKRVEFNRLIFDASWNRFSVEELKKKLVEEGFTVEPRVCTGCEKTNDRPGDDTETLCYTCAYRRDNPGGPGTPAWVQRLNERTIKNGS